jgi:hypothetical protein
MVFRQLEQDVPGFHRHLEENGKNWRDFIPDDYTGRDLTDKEGAALWGARLLGRWESVSSPPALAASITFAYAWLFTEGCTSG